MEGASGRIRHAAPLESIWENLQNLDRPHSLPVAGARILHSAEIRSDAGTCSLSQESNGTVGPSLLAIGDFMTVIIGDYYEDIHVRPPRNLAAAFSIAVAVALAVPTAAMADL